MKVWDEQHSAPTDVGIPHEQSVLAWWKDQNDRQLKKLIPDPSAEKADASKQLAEYRRIVGGAWQVFFDRKMPAKEELKVFVASQQPEQPNSKIYLVQHPEWETEVRVLVQDPHAGPRKRTIIVASDKQSVSDQTTILAAGLLSLNFNGDKQSRVVMMDFGDDPPTQRLIKEKRNYSAFSFGYNRPLIAKRFEQILCAIALFSPASDGEDQDEDLLLFADGNVAGPAATAAAVVAADDVDEFHLHTSRFRFASVDNYKDASFLPGAVKYFDLPGLMSLRAPHAMSVTGETGETVELVKRIYKAAGAPDAFQLQSLPTFP